jgi:DNA mismatch endonuclease, patch repair protein
MDIVDQETRSRMMRSVRQRDTLPEVRLRRALHGLGLRYRLGRRDLPGSPDIVFPRFKAVVFVHGCFWHAHNCRFATVPTTRPEFWEAKFEANRQRDARVVRELVVAGWWPASTILTARRQLSWPVGSGE